MKPDARLLTADEVAGMLGMGVDWVYSETRANRIPHVKLGRYRRYRRESIERWISDLESETMTASIERPRDARTSGGMAQGVSAP